MVKSRLNYTIGLLEVCLGLLIGMLLAAERDLHLLEKIAWSKHIGTQTVAAHWLTLAHVHFGVLGILNIVLSFIPLKEFVKIALAFGCVVVPLGFVLYIIDKSLIYINIAGTIALISSLIYLLFEAIFKKRNIQA